MTRIDRGEWSEVAGILDDPVSKGKAASLRVHTMPATSRDLALATAENAADALEPAVKDSTAIQVLGMLTSAAALQASVTYDYERAGHWLDQADELAGRVPDTPTDNWGAFSSTNVAVWRAALAVERGATGGTLLELAEKVDEARLEGRRGRRAAFLADVGRGPAREPRMRTEAVQWLSRAEAVAPHKIRNSAPVRETVASLLTQAVSTSGAQELRGMAARRTRPSRAHGHRRRSFVVARRPGARDPGLTASRQDGPVSGGGAGRGPNGAAGRRGRGRPRRPRRPGGR